MTKDECRDTGMAVVLLLLILYFATKRQNLVAWAVLFHVVNMTAPRVYRPVAVLWLGFSHLLGTVVSRIVLSVVFLVVVTPVAIVRKLSGKDSLNLRGFKASQGSAMVKRDHMFTGKDLEKPY
jgi:hypothetical protein